MAPTQRTTQESLADEIERRGKDERAIAVLAESIAADGWPGVYAHLAACSCGACAACGLRIVANRLLRDFYRDTAPADR